MTMQSREIPITESYNDVRSLLDLLARRMSDRFHDDYDDVRSDADLAFLKAYRSFDPTMGVAKFSSYVGRCVHNLLVQNGLKRMRHRIPTCDLESNLLSNFGIAKTFDLADFAYDLTDDARDVVNLALAMGANGGRSLTIRKRIRDRLLEMGWSKDRVRKSFRCVANALSYL